MYEDLMKRWEGLKDRLDKLRRHLDLKGKQERIDEIDRIMAAPESWSDKEKAQSLLQERSAIMEWVDAISLEGKKIEETGVMIELGGEGEDAALLNEAEQCIKGAEKSLDVLELRALFSKENDRNNAIISIHSGAGGTESQDWAEMLLRMYMRWLEEKGFQAKVFDYLPGQEAGVKSVSFLAIGPYAYGYLKGESGVHRLVRISPFDASGRRHTSFASVFVYPELDESIHVEIDEKDLRIDTYRSSGAGGQHVNVTDSAVRITHIPTNIVVQCQNERSQHQNKDMAMKLLRSRLYELKLEEQRQELDKINSEKKNIAWGSQIRSYVFQPYQLIKDHRTGVEIGNVNSVMDGNIDPFIEAYLRWQSGSNSHYEN
ncbi:peptide chain release factor 2 [bacterium]|nr:peptide chain release factor 2 [bacterium]